MEERMSALQTIHQLQNFINYNRSMSAQNYTPIHHLLDNQPSRTLHKEKEPYASSLDNFEIQEVVEHEPHEEVGEFITHRPETVKLREELSKIGIHATGSTQFPSLQNVVIPISDDKVLSGLHAPITSSLRWLATFAVYLLKRAHIALKVVRGHAVRVFRS